MQTGFPNDPVWSFNNYAVVKQISDGRPDLIRNSPNQQLALQEQIYLVSLHWSHWWNLSRICSQARCSRHVGGCQLLIVTVLQSGVVLISCIDFYVIHSLAGSPKQESILWRVLLLLKANLVLMMHEEIFEHWHFSVRFLLKNQLR